jgi:hypothetical protein
MERRLIDVARYEGLRRIIALLLSENAALFALARRLHFAIVRGENPLSLAATLDLI